MWLEKKERHNKKHGVWKEELAKGNIVLSHDIQREKNISQKLAFKWLGPYQIYNTMKEKGIYMFEKLDRLYLAGTFVNDKLKKLYPYQWLQLDHIPNLDHKEVATLN